MPDETYARFTDAQGRIISGQFKTKLDVLCKQFEDTTVRVGVTDSSQVPKAIIHEFGAHQQMTFEEDGKEYSVKGVPARSFIRTPMILFLPQALEAIDDLTLNGKKFDTDMVANALGETAVEVIHEAFATQGFGQWLPHLSKKYAADNDNPVLDRTGALKNSIGYEVTNKETL